MSAIWSDQARLEIWLEIETLALEAMAEEGTVPKEAAEALRKRGKFSVERTLEIEAEVKHDVIAFLTDVAEHVGPLSRFTHRGMTSSDLLDTAFAVQIKRAGELLLSGLDSLIEATRKRAEEYKLTPCIGRSHGIHAEPITFGLKIIGWYAELTRHRKRLAAELLQAAVGKISGAVGTYASVTPGVEQRVMRKLGLIPETVATQVVQRDRHAALFAAIALIGSSLERFATEVRHLQRTEVREVEESFSKGQKGSSAMPHKRNPILCENLTGLARLLRGYSLTAMENVPLWHERDISHSSVERVIGPDAFILLDFMIHRFRSVVVGMQVNTEQMQTNLDLSRGLVFSGTLLLALTDKGMVREEAYRLVQEHSMAAWQGGEPLFQRVSKDQSISALLSAAELQDLFSLERHTKRVQFIFNRAINGEGGEWR